MRVNLFMIIARRKTLIIISMRGNWLGGVGCRAILSSPFEPLKLRIDLIRGQSVSFKLNFIDYLTR